MLLAQELVRDYHKEHGVARCTLKHYLRKAYDSVEWDFILHCLSCFGFSPVYIHWIRECITNAWFCVAINGTLVGYFEGARGLRQEDPLSSYLFVVATKILTRMMAEVAMDKRLYDFHPRCSKLKITHLSFAYLQL